ncbi:efflux transporter periplasmic adaptor subunit, partial [Pseudomonas aeruginosa]
MDQLPYTLQVTDVDGVIPPWQAEERQVVRAGQAVITLAPPEARRAVFNLAAVQGESIPGDASLLGSAQ